MSNINEVHRSRDINAGSVPAMAPRTCLTERTMVDHTCTQSCGQDAVRISTGSRIVVMGMLKKLFHRYLPPFLPALAARRHTEKYLARSTDIAELERRMVEFEYHGD